MPINPLQHGDKVLLVRQRHEAKRMGLHWDYRFVLDDKAYSFATKKQMPEPGRSIVLFEQPVHDAAYALSQRIEIPDGNYGAGVTTLDWAKKATIESHEDGTMVVNTGDQRFLLKKLDGAKYGQKSWLFKNLSPTPSLLEKAARIRHLRHASKSEVRELIEGELSGRAVDAVTPKKKHRKRKAIEKKADLTDEFRPDLTPEQMHTLGVLIHPGSQYQDGKPTQNFFGVSAGLREWPEEWLNDEAPVGWYQWYQGYANGKRTDDDERQIKRWKSFKARMTGVLKKQDPTLEDLSVAPKARQSLLNWGVAPGMDIGRALETGNVNRYLEKIAVALALYQCPVTQQRRWYVNGEEVPAGWVELKKTYKRFPKA